MEIERAFRIIGSDSVRVRLLKRFRDARGNNLAQLHAYRELLFGAWAAGVGYAVEYEPALQDKRPDWVISRSGKSFVMEVTSLHSPKPILDQVEALREGDVLVFDVDVEQATRRIASKIQEKANKYTSLGGIDGLIISVWLDFDLCIHSDELLRRLSPTALWSCDRVCGIAFCDECPRREIRLIDRPATC